METEKKNETEEKNLKKDWHNYHHSSSRAFFVILLFILIVGFAFLVGRASNRVNKFTRFGAIETVNVNRGGPGYDMIGRRGMMNGGLRQGGISGSITNISDNTLTVKDADGTEYAVNIATNTSIIISGKVDKLSNLKVNDLATIYGPSNSDGSINAQTVNIR